MTFVWVGLDIRIIIIIKKIEKWVLDAELAIKNPKINLKLILKKKKKKVALGQAGYRMMMIIFLKHPW